MKEMPETCADPLNAVNAIISMKMKRFFCVSAENIGHEKDFASNDKSNSLLEKGLLCACPKF